MPRITTSRTQGVRRTINILSRNRARTVAASNQPGPSATAASADSQAIAQLAYELWERRGYSHGRDLDDWLEAERLLRSRRATRRV